MPMIEALKTDKKAYYRLLFLMTAIALSLITISSVLGYQALVNDRQEQLHNTLDYKALDIEKLFQNRRDANAPVDEEFQGNVLNSFMRALRSQDENQRNFGSVTALKIENNNAASNYFTPLYTSPTGSTLSVDTRHQATRALLQDALTDTEGELVYTDESGTRVVSVFVSIPELGLVVFIEFIFSASCCC